MAVSAQDILDITNSITDNITLDITSTSDRTQLFSGLQKDAISWIEDFEFKADANLWNDDKKILKMGTVLTGIARDWFTMDIIGKGLDWNNTKALFLKQFLPVDIESHFRKEFLERKQQSSESCANFICAKRNLLKRSKLVLSEEETVEQILSQMLGPISQKLMVFNPKTFDELKLRSELIERGLKRFQESVSSDGKITTIMGVFSDLHLYDDKQQDDYYDRVEYSSRKQRGDIICYYCNKFGHIEDNCYSKYGYDPYCDYNYYHSYSGDYMGDSNQSQNYYTMNDDNYYSHNDETRDDYEDNSHNYDDYDGTVALIRNEVCEREQQVSIAGMMGKGLQIFTKINGFQAKTLVDTGATHSFISFGFVQKNRFITNEFVGKNYYLTNGDIYQPKLKTNIKMEITLSNKTKVAELSIFVIDKLSIDAILGYNIIKSLGIIIDGRKQSLYYG